VKRLWKSPTLRSMVVYGTAGAGFAGANLILARVLPKEEYALFTLVLAIGNLGYSLAPTGVDGIVNRRHLAAGPQLLWRVILAAGTVALIFTAIGLLGYGLGPGIGLYLLVSVAAGGAMMVAGAKFQSQQRFAISLSLIQSPNVVLLFAALAVVAFNVRHLWLALLISALGFVVAGLIGWAVLLREHPAGDVEVRDFPWKEALSLAGLEVAGLTLVQLERLVIPHTLSVSDLATYGVLGAIVGSLFRVMQMGVGYTLFPRLRAATSVEQRRQLIAHEAKLSIGLVLIGSVVIGIATPIVEELFLRGKYHLTVALIVAALISGIVKIMNAFAKATVSALATHRELAVVNLLGWGSVLLAVAAAVFGARWGLVGVIYGVALGWLARAATTLHPIVRHLRLPEIPAGHPAVSALDR
jgi:O-antigen/teichoic acid export membrane protein